MAASTGEPVWYPDASSRQLAIVAALSLERDIFVAAVRHSEIAVYCSGPGPARAAETARRAIADGATALMSFGLAGGLVATAATGDVALPERLLGDGIDARADTAWHRRLVDWL
ncbi:MAG: hypothetical protein R3305_06035, partial [Gammaproteobacteria bacterium]|nr:hypothetical protein [Gammaproteobacteria bacterium]